MGGYSNWMNTETISIMPQRINNTTQIMKYSIKNFFSKCAQICRMLYLAEYFFTIFYSSAIPQFNLTIVSTTLISNIIIITYSLLQQVFSPVYQYQFCASVLESIEGFISFRRKHDGPFLNAAEDWKGCHFTNKNLSDLKILLHWRTLEEAERLTSKST